MSAPISNEQRALHIATEAAGVVLSPIAAYIGTRMRNPAAGMFITLGATTMFFVDLALLAHWGYKQRTGR